MLSHTQAWADALAGSVQPAVQVDAWYDGVLVGKDLNVVSGSISYDSTALIQCSGTVVLGSPDDSIIPTDFDSMLACGGSILHIQQGIRIPGSTVELKDLGWLRIGSSDVQETWQPYTPGGDVFLYGGTAAGPGGAGDVVDDGTPPSIVGGDPPLTPAATVLATRGAQVTAQVADLMTILDEDQFLAPEQPAATATVLGEITRLAAHAGLVLGDVTGWTDRLVPASVTDGGTSGNTYGDSRSAAVASLAAVLGATARLSRTAVGGVGVLELVPAVPSLTTPVWSIGFGDATGPPLVSFARSWDRAGIYNAVKSTGTDQAGNQIVAYALETDGPLRYGGPFGRLVYQHDSPLITSQAAARTDAQTTLANLIAQRTVTIPLAVPANTALETLDVVSVELPKAEGSQETVVLTGWVASMTVTLGSATMQIGLEVPRAQIGSVS